MISIIVVGFLSFFASLMPPQGNLKEAYDHLFHIFHPAHILFSAVTTTAIFWKYEKILWKAVFIGLFGTIPICTLSDILIPYLGGMFLNLPMEMHICFIEEPMLVLPFGIMGVLSGLVISESVEQSTKYSHSAHIFVSSMASLIYLISFGLNDWAHMLGAIFLITVIAVALPCCTSDIIFPIMCARKPMRCDHNH